VFCLIHFTLARWLGDTSSVNAPNQALYSPGSPAINTRNSWSLTPSTSSHHSGAASSSVGTRASAHQLRTVLNILAALSCR